MGDLIGVALATTIVTLTMTSNGYAADLSSVTDSGNSEILMAFNEGFSRAFMVSFILIILSLSLTSLRSRKVQQQTQ